jgi:transcriptional regulator with XRE-family HTH domain
MSTSDLRSVADRVRYLRELAGVKAHALSLYAGLAQGHVGMIERGRVAEPTRDTLEAIGRATGASWLWLLAGEGDPPTRDEVRSALERIRSDVDVAATGTEG